MTVGTDGSIAERLGERLRADGASLATAESATGGLVASLVTDVPGASDYFDRGVVTYAYDAKREVLGVTREALDEHGAVSEPVARQMARRVRDRSGTTWGLSVTGVAGPTGGTEEKPVGTVYLGVAYAAEWGSRASYADVERRQFEGSRSTVKSKAAEAALELLLSHVESRA
jgi:nicotinamide-nucleotide amidase